MLINPCMIYGSATEFGVFGFFFFLWKMVKIVVSFLLSLPNDIHIPRRS